MPAADLQALFDNALEQVRGAWRFRWIALAVCWTVAPILWVLIFLIPDSYQATAQVFVDTNTTLNEATRGMTIGVNVDSQISRVRQALLGGPQLESVAEQTNLIMAGMNARAKQFVLNKLRDDIDISGALSQDGYTAGVFTISYKNRSRNESLQVVSQLLNTFVEGTLGGKREGSQQAQQFLLDQIQDYARRLSAAEQRLADFKRKYVGLMPGAQGDYFTRLQTALDGLEKARGKLRVAERRRQELQQELRGQPAFTPGESTMTLADGSPVVVSDTSTQIKQAQQRLDELLLKYTDQYPDIIALKETIKELKARQQAELAAVRRGDPGAAASLGLTSNPVYQSIQLQYNQSQVEIAAIGQDIADREAKVAQLRSLVTTAPEVEAKFAALNRDYNVTKGQYNDLVQRLDRAQLGQQAENTGIVKFEVIDPPHADFTPIAPKRGRLILLAFLFSIAAGGAVAYLLHLLRPVFLSAKQLSDVTGYPVLGSVSMTWLERTQFRRRRGMVAYAGALAALAGVAIVLLLLHGYISQAIRGHFA